MIYHLVMIELSIFSVDKVVYDLLLLFRIKVVFHWQLCVNPFQMKSLDGKIKKEKENGFAR